MKLIRARVMLAAGLIAAAGAVTGTVLAAAPVSAASGPVVLVDPCHGRPLFRPAVYDVGCMPANEFVSNLSWTSWRSVAFGGGILRVNNCTPSSSCGPSRFTRYPILVVLWRAKPWPSHAGRDYFSRLTWIFTGKRPARTPVSQTLTLPAG